MNFFPLNVHIGIHVENVEQIPNLDFCVDIYATHKGAAHLLKQPCKVNIQSQL